ncbi:unnamed protein product [Plutella xylostella]|uniref:(diamondback moth) hypothetical protein n=1 Tax=Plutella xylostella TaxID=51655 RepID=A0A8S4DWY7_PLUXY|nr:unnamed protein product [Plutella xylostella]
MDLQHEEVDKSDLVNINTEKSVTRVDITYLHCKLCKTPIESLEMFANHLANIHDLPTVDKVRWLVPVRLETNRYVCVLCDKKYTGETEETETSKAWTNAAIILKHSTAYPFQLDGSSIKCCFCRLSFDDPQFFREHVASVHKLVDRSRALQWSLSLKVDITGLQCTTCPVAIESLDLLTEHLKNVHNYDIKTISSSKLVPMRLETDRHTCIFCERNFSGLRELSRHSGTHFLRYKCDTCGKGYETNKGLAGHILSRHSNSELKFFCSSCKQRFPSSEAKRKHCEENIKCETEETESSEAWINAAIILKHSTAYPFQLFGSSIKCCFCTLTFDEPSIFRKHVDSIHRLVDRCRAMHRRLSLKIDITDLQCTTCTAAFESLDLLTVHLKNEHNYDIKTVSTSKLVPIRLAPDRHTCVFCETEDTETRKAWNNAAIVLKRSTAYPFQLYGSSIQCCFCRLTFDDPPFFRKHVDSFHQRVDRAQALRRPVNLRVDITDLQCRTCKVAFESLDLITEHLKNVHQYGIETVSKSKLVPMKLATDRHTCVFCERNFSGLRELSRHSGTHFLRHKCETCGNGYETNMSLTRHILSAHTNSDMKIFLKRGDSLAAPMAIPKENAKLMLRHTTAYPFIQIERKYIGCCFCYSPFEDPTQFREHMDWEHHQIDKSTVVTEKFTTRVDIHDLRCKICKEGFPTLEPLSEHLISQHQIKIDSQHDLGLAPLKLEKERFFCYVCQKVFIAFYALFVHAISHLSRNICDACGKNFATQNGLDRHVLNSHTVRVDFPCKRCKQTFPSKEKRREHLAMSKSCLPIRCRQCHDRFTCKEMLEHHRVNVHGMTRRMHTCKLCGEVYHNRTLLYFHFKSTHTDDLRCQYCDRTFKVRSSLQEHVNSTHTGERPFNCPVCEKGLVSKKALAKHVIIHDDTKKVPCPVCGRLFVAREHMDSEHQIDRSTLLEKRRKKEDITRVDIFQLRCNLCKVDFPTLEVLAEHLISQHQIKIDNEHDLGLVPLKLENDRFYCYECEKVFQGFYGLYIHTSLHLPRHICAVCGRNFATKKGLDEHVQSTHTGPKQFSCLGCKQGFPSLQERREHFASSQKCWRRSCRQCKERFISDKALDQHCVDVHGMAKRTFTCKMCGEVYYNRTLLHLHFKSTHTDDLKCQYCDKTFKTRDRLEEHVNYNHTGDRPFKCDVCDKGCTMSGTDPLQAPMAIPKENAKLMLKYSTAYPFVHKDRTLIGCSFCPSAFEDANLFRKHMDSEHQIDRSTVVNEKFITRVDIIDLRCKVCKEEFPTLEPLAQHLVSHHHININLQHDVGLAALKLENDRFYCYICEKVFQGFYGLFLHAALHLTRHICDVCGRNFSTQKGLDGHVLTNHKDVFSCNRCKMSFPTKEMKREHLALNKQCWPHRCKLCNDRFKCSQMLEHHRVNVHGKTRTMFPCKSCNEVYHDRTLLYYHFKTIHSKDLTCQYCNKVFKLRRTLEQHVYANHTARRRVILDAPMAIPKENAKLILKHSTAYPFIHSERKCIGCCFCSSAFEDPHSFRQHMDSEHQIDRSVTVNEKFITRVDIFELRCNVCTAEFPTLEPLAEHLVSQHQINIDTQHDLGLAALKLEKDRFFCYVCQKVFMAFYGLFLHSILHATRNICDVCGRNFATQKGLDGHVRSSHTTKVDFPCRGCKQTFESKEKRREHMATSKKCLPIRCRQCNERFTCKETLEHHHVESHGMPRRMYACKSCGGEFHNRTLLHYHFKANHTTDLKCQYCEKTFKVRSSLQEHVYFTHTGERPYKCSVCDKGVVSLRALAKHAIVHDDTKKLPCPVCGRLFIAKWKVRDHLKRHHPEIAPY